MRKGDTGAESTGAKATGTKRWGAANIPDQSGRVALITGANRGIGLETARALAASGASVVLACRDEASGHDAAELIAARVGGARPTVIQLDLADLSSVGRATVQLRDSLSRLDVLIANAGVSMPPPGVTVDGFEVQFATNHLGHFALVADLLDLLVATPASRVVTLTSVTEIVGGLRLDELLAGGSPGGRVRSYARSKLACLVFALELDRRFRLAGVEARALAAHPGSARTDIARHIPRVEELLAPLSFLLQQEAADGALPVVRAATDPGLPGGSYVTPGGWFHWRGAPVRARPPRRAQAPAAGWRLWRASEAMTGRRLDPAQARRYSVSP